MSGCHPWGAGTPYVWAYSWLPGRECRSRSPKPPCLSLRRWCSCQEQRMGTASSNALLPHPTDGSRAALLSLALMFLSASCTQLAKNIPGRPKSHCLWDLAALEWVTSPSPLHMGQRTIQRGCQTIYACPNCRDRAKGSCCQKTACLWGFFWFVFSSRFPSQTGSDKRVKWDLGLEQGEKGRAGPILGWNSARVTSSPHMLAPP